VSGRLVIGIDPGLTGACGVLNADGSFRGVFDLPIIRDGKLAWVDPREFERLLFLAIGGEEERPAVMIERVQAMPRQGVSSSFNFGVGFGSLLSVIQANELRLEFVQPSLWKRALGLGERKAAALDKARLLWPQADLVLKKHEGRAEALLIAHWALMRSSQIAA
jgi:crossover junction endodeoxyribonuclease RuvC